MEDKMYTLKVRYASGEIGEKEFFKLKGMLQENKIYPAKHPDLYYPSSAKPFRYEEQIEIAKMRLAKGEMTMREYLHLTDPLHYPMMD